MDIPADRQQWYAHLCRFAGADPTVHAYRDEAAANSIEIFRSAGESGTLLATIGLMDVDQGRDPAAPVFSEILMDCLGDDERLGNALATVAFHVMKHGVRIAPGLVFDRMIAMYFPESSLPHAMLVPPFQWDSGMTQVQLATKTIYPLVAVPISEAERKFTLESEPRALERVWASERVNVFDWSRASAV